MPTESNSPRPGAAEPTELTRDELYAKVWSGPMSKLAPAFGLSDRGLAKICERHRIPRPPRGYWRRLQTGKRVGRKPLPPLLLSEAALATVTIHPSPVLEPTEGRPSMTSLQEDFEGRPENRIEVPERVGRYHPLVQQTRKALDLHRRMRGDVDMEDVRLRLDVQVEGEQQRRALLIMDTLIKALERRDFAVEVKGDKTGWKCETVVLLQEVEIPIRLREGCRQVKLSPDEQGRWGYPSVRIEGTGELALEILWDRRGLRRTWKDGKRRRVESRLNEFIVGLVRAAEAKRRWLRDLEESRQRWAAEEEARRERERLRRLEEARCEELRRQAAAWEECQRLRAYIAAVREAAAQKGLLAPEGKLAAWIAWAEQYVETADPLNRLDDLPFDPEETPQYAYRAGSR